MRNGIEKENYMQDPKNHPLNVPDDPNLNGVKVGDSVTITCTDNDGCTWCYSDPDDVFEGNFLACGSYDKGALGTYTTVNPGKVFYDGVKGKNKPCNPEGDPDTGHTILVGN